MPQPSPNSCWQSVTAWIESQWSPKPINPPSVDPELGQLDGLQRSAEAIRYSILSIEFWISPNGQAREWLRQNARLAVWIAIPAFLIMPVITFVLAQLNGWIGILVAIAGNLIVFPVVAILAGLVILIAIRIVKALTGWT